MIYHKNIKVKNMRSFIQCLTECGVPTNLFCALGFFPALDTETCSTYLCIIEDRHDQGHILYLANYIPTM